MMPVRPFGPVLLALVLSACAVQGPPSSRQIDALVNAALEEFSVPGAAVGVILDGKVVHARGYGIREVGATDAIDTATLFRIASTTKAMTAASLAILVDEGKLNWDDKVVDLVPGFALYDPWVTAEFTVADLLTHRSGLEPYAGDLMLWPKPNFFSRADIVAGLRYFKAESGFRTEYAYDNLMYIVAGEIVPALTGQSWEAFVDARILGAIGARRCFAGDIPATEMHNIAAPHLVVDGELEVVERNRANATVEVDAAAGGVRCSLDDMLRWASLQLAGGETDDGRRIFSAEQGAAMWQPQTILLPGREQQRRDRTHFRAYGFGWRLADVHGYKEVSHTGSFTGFRAQVSLYPELGLGVVVLLNASAGDARAAIVHGIVKPALGVTGTDWIEYFARDADAGNAATEAVADIDFRNGRVERALADYAGLYRDPWFGDVRVELRDDALWLDSVKSPRFSGRMWPFANDTFYVHWQDRTLEADVWARFIAGADGRVTALDLEQVSDASDWDFTDLALTRVAAE